MSQTLMKKIGSTASLHGFASIKPEDQAVVEEWFALGQVRQCARGGGSDPTAASGDAGDTHRHARGRRPRHTRLPITFSPLTQPPSPNPVNTHSPTAF
jgi:hypothetical protein